MSGPTVVVRGDEPADIDELRTALDRAFLQVRAAIAQESPVVIVVPAEDLMGHRSPEGAAYVNALVGMTRAVAFEGARAGWRINVVAVPSAHGLDDSEAVRAVATEGLSGQVVTLGIALLGKLIP
jgi:NAD(P)-dependent dehydrogenase (short-subunit alcohol dehydrogenase family)